MNREEESGVADFGERAFCRTDANSSAERQGVARRKFQVRPRIDEAPVDYYPVGRLYLSLRERGHGDIADIAVPRQLNPAPAFVLLVQNHFFAKQRLGVEGRIGSRRVAQIGGADTDLQRAAFDVSIGGDLA